MREQVGRRRNWPVGELSLEIQKLVGYLFSGECVKHKHDPPSEIKVRGTAAGDENARMRTLRSECLFVQPLIVAAIMGEDRPEVRRRKVKLCGVRASEVVRVSCSQHVKAVRTEKLSDKYGHIFIQVQSDKEQRVGHWRRG